ncbi:hypothetical protein QKA_2369 [Clostridioides difficile DA00165]|nr:hypothetical protein QKA_2369 [Clostridioides difficile DA00165]
MIWIFNGYKNRSNIYIRRNYMKIAIFLGAGASAAENLPIQNELSEYF